MDNETNLYDYDDNFNFKLIKRLINNNIDCDDPDKVVCIVGDNICLIDDKNCINVINLITFK